MSFQVLVDDYWSFLTHTFVFLVHAKAFTCTKEQKLLWPWLADVCAQWRKSPILTSTEALQKAADAPSLATATAQKEQVSTGLWMGQQKQLIDWSAG